MGARLYAGTLLQVRNCERHSFRMPSDRDIDLRLGQDTLCLYLPDLHISNFITVRMFIALTLSHISDWRESVFNINRRKRWEM